MMHQQQNIATRSQQFISKKVLKKPQKEIDSNNNKHF